MKIKTKWGATKIIESVDNKILYLHSDVTFIIRELLCYIYRLTYFVWLL